MLPTDRITGYLFDRKIARITINSLTCDSKIVSGVEASASVAQQKKIKSANGNRALADKAAVDAILEKKSTVKDVKSILGDPNHAESESNGDKIWSYWLHTVHEDGTMASKNLVLRIRKGVVVDKDVSGSGG